MLNTSRAAKLCTLVGRKVSTDENWNYSVAALNQDANLEWTEQRAQLFFVARGLIITNQALIPLMSYDDDTVRGLGYPSNVMLNQGRILLYLSTYEGISGRHSQSF